jgi:hypothetical protein
MIDRPKVEFSDASFLHAAPRPFVATCGFPTIPLSLSPADERSIPFSFDGISMQLKEKSVSPPERYSLKTDFTLSILAQMELSFCFLVITGI